MFDGMRAFSIHAKNEHQDIQGKKRAPIHVNHYCFVGAGGREVIPDRFLGCNALGLFVQGKRDDINDG
jgi:hypothetical protein